MLYLGDCLEVMPIFIESNSIDMVLCDPPYGTTQCKWDTPLDLKKIWLEINRITKLNATICFFGVEPFSSFLRMSNIKNFKYDWYLKKNSVDGFLNAKKQPLREYEIASIFYRKQPKYKPQLVKIKPFKTKINSTGKQSGRLGKVDLSLKYETRDFKYPKNTIEFNTVKKAVHPTQKPIALLEYLIKTYTLENEMVLDFTMGSGSTGVACKNLNRKFIGIEKEKKYFDIAKNRIENA